MDGGNSRPFVTRDVLYSAVDVYHDDAEYFYKHCTIRCNHSNHRHISYIHLYVFSIKFISVRDSKWAERDDLTFVKNTHTICNKKAVHTKDKSKLQCP